MRNILWQSDAWNEYEALQAEKATLKRTNKLLKDIMRNGYQCSYGKVEMLKGDFSGYASVRIDQKNRLIFSVDDYTITVIQCGGHYDDKLDIGRLAGRILVAFLVKKQKNIWKLRNMSTRYSLKGT